VLPASGDQFSSRDRVNAEKLPSRLHARANQFLESMRSTHADVLNDLAAGNLSDNSIKVIEEVIANIDGQYK